MNAALRALIYTVCVITIIIGSISIIGIPVAIFAIWAIYKVRKNNQITDTQHRLKEMQKIEEQNQQAALFKRMREATLKKQAMQKGWEEQ